ncbi:flagellar basal body-associated protein FliL [Motilimonas pumila]|uniref:Flagellar protein FliL n=1 Tax=Motilimonas pumila TaxID=2303987 RepID=A0A418YJ94_9GAMM|nr:flagellar basal body-associated protein FliL [Motilimonas pumila]RJG50564.1 flagellar basal body-associated protein FliL [Motilimonas pumila]
MKKGILPLILLFFFSSFSFAEEEGKTAGYAYYALEPDIITNYIKPGKRIGYVRMAVELQLENSSDLTILQHHDPLLRDAIIEILGQKSEQQIKSLSGRDEIRNECLEAINKLLVQEEGNKAVAEVIFTKYLYQ